MGINPDWERAAADWIVWARAPGHDEYWTYRDACFALVPPPGRATLEIGCGGFAGTIERDGLRLELTGWTQPLEAYMAAFGAAGLAVEPLRPGGDGRWRRIPSFLMLRARNR